MAKIHWWFIDTFWLSQACRSASYSVWQLTQQSIFFFIEAPHLATVGVTLYLRLLLYILLLIFQSSESPHLPLCRSVYICFNNISCFASSTHFNSTFILVWLLVNEKSRKKKLGDQLVWYLYLYMLWRIYLWSFSCVKKMWCCCACIILIEIRAQEDWIGSVNRKFYCHSYYWSGLIDIDDILL